MSSSDNKKSPRRFRMFPLGIAECLSPIVTPAMKKRGFGEYKIITEWETIVGHELARVTRPQKVSFPPQSKTGGTLHLHVLGAHALEVQMALPQIIEQIATYTGYRAIAQIKMVQAGHSLPLAKPYKN